MKEWKTYKLGDLINIQSGGTPNKAVSAYWGGNIPWISAKTMYVDFITDSDIHITEEGLKNGSKLAPVGSILLLTRGSGLFNRIPVCLVKEAVAYNQDIKCITVKDNSITSNTFIFFWLYSQKELLSGILETTGIGAGKIDSGRLLDINVTLPDIETQNKFTLLCSSIFEKIEINKQINDNLEQQAQAAFNNIIANTTSDKTVRLSEIAWLNPKRSISKGKVARSIEMAHLPTTGSFPSGWEMKEYNGGMKFQNGDTLMARITPCLENGKVAFVNFLEDDEIAFGSTEYITMTPKRQFAPEVLYFLVRNAEFIDFAVKNMNGSSGRQRVSADTIGTYELPDITLEELHMLETIAREALTKIKYNSLENMRLADMRDTLLPKLMSGELKINEIDC